MKKLLTAAFAASFVLSPALAPALAGDLEGYCVEYTTGSGGDPSGCACLAEQADASMAEELMAVASEADLEGLSDASKEALATCWPS